MPRSITDPDFKNKFTGIHDHEHAYDLTESISKISEGDANVDDLMENAEEVLSVVEVSIQNIKTLFDGLQPQNKQQYIQKFARLKSKLHKDHQKHLTQGGKVTGFMSSDTKAAIETHNNLAEVKGKAVTIADALIKEFQKTPKQPKQPKQEPDPYPHLPDKPQNLFAVGDKKLTALLLTEIEKLKVNDNTGKLETLIELVVGSSKLVQRINSDYAFIRKETREKRPLLKKINGLKDDPNDDLSRLLLDEKTHQRRFEPLFNKIISLRTKYTDLKKETSRSLYTKPKDNGIDVHESAKSEFLVSDTKNYLKQDDSSIELASVTSAPSLNQSCTYTDDKGRDCKSYFTHDAAGNLLINASGKAEFDAAKFCKDHPDVKKITVKRPMLLKGKRSGVLDGEKIQLEFEEKSVVFEDEITFNKLEKSERINELQALFANDSKKQTLIDHLFTQKEKLRARLGISPTEMGVLEKLLREPSHPGTEQISGLIEHNLYPATATPTFAERLVIAVAARLAEQSFTTTDFQEKIQELDEQKFERELSVLDKKPLLEELHHALKNKIANAPGNTIPAALPANISDIDILENAGKSNDNAQKDSFGFINKWTTGLFAKRGRKLDLAAQTHAFSANNRIHFWDPKNIPDYRFLMGLGDHQGDVKEKISELPGTKHAFRDVKTKIDIQGPNQIDFDVSVPAQGSSAKFAFDGQRADPPAVRIQMDTEMQTIDWKLALHIKLLFETELLERLQMQNGDIVAKLGTEVRYLGLDGGAITLKKKGEDTVYRADSCKNETEATNFVNAVRHVMNAHVSSAKTLLTDGGKDTEDTILSFPTLASIENANTSSNDDYDLSWDKEKTFGSTTVKIAYKGTKGGTYKLHITDGSKEEAFDSVGQIVMSTRYATIALDLMSWFHEQMLDELLLNRKELPNNRTYVVQDPISGDRYGFYYEFGRLRYGSIQEKNMPGAAQQNTINPNSGAEPVKGTFSQKMLADFDPKGRCVMYDRNLVFEKGSEERAKKTICGRKDMFYSLMYTTMATSKAGKKEREWIEKQNEESKKAKDDFLSELVSPKNRGTLRQVGKGAFNAMQKKK